MRRTAVVNQIRSLLLERGLTLSKGRRHLDEQLPRILEDADLNLSGSFRVLLAQLQLELQQLAAHAASARPSNDATRRVSAPPKAQTVSLVS